jgi:hypothetical protein
VAGESSKVRVAFIAGAGFSGSTLLEQSLSQIEGCVSIGGLHPLFEHYWPVMVCECGKRHRECEFWQGVLEDAYGASANEQGAKRERARVLGKGFVAHSPMSALMRSSPKFSLKAAFRELGTLIEPIYRAVAARTGAQVVVDSSKAAPWGLSSLAAPGVDLRVVHLIKDPRAFAYSNGRPHAFFYPLGSTTVPRGPIRSFGNWGLANIEAEYLARQAPHSMTVLYESLARRPEETLASIVDMLGIEGDVALPVRDHELTVDRPGHAIGGNARRPRHGVTSIEFDERWRTDGSRELRTLGPLLAGPFWWHWKRRAAQSTRESVPTPG